MSIKNQKRLLLLCTLVVWGVGFVVFEWAFEEVTLPTEGFEVQLPQRTQANATDSSELEPTLVVSTFEPHWKKALRQQLYDPPPPPPKKVVKPKPKPIRGTVLATMLESNNTMAMVQLPGNQVVFRKVGEVLGPENPDAVIKEIKDGFIVLERDEEQIKLTVQGK